MEDNYLSAFPLNESTSHDTSNTKFEPLPIVSYDTNTGLGYGIKAFLLNAIKSRESFDLILFNSSKGERWYRFVFSIPDFELRQGRRYPLALDLVINFDRWIAYHFYGVGNQAHYENEEKHTRRLFETALNFSRGFNGNIVSQFSLRYRNIGNSGLDSSGQLLYLPPRLNQSTVEYLAVFIGGRFDTRNSFINPSHGQVVQLETEIVPAMVMNNQDYIYYAMWYQYYTRFSALKTTLAIRAGIRHIVGKNLPVQVLLPIGGDNTLRGYAQDRFLDKFSLLFNTEFRFPVYKRLGAIAGLDAGKVWSAPGKMDLNNWPYNGVLGLRYYFNTYIVRLDLGISRESYGLYINFGQVF